MYLAAMESLVAETEYKNRASNPGLDEHRQAARQQTSFFVPFTRKNFPFQLKTPAESSG